MTMTSDIRCKAEPGFDENPVPVLPTDANMILGNCNSAGSLDAYGAAGVPKARYHPEREHRSLTAALGGDGSHMDADIQIYARAPFMPVRDPLSPEMNTSPHTFTCRPGLLGFPMTTHRRGGGSQTSLAPDRTNRIRDAAMVNLRYHVGGSPAQAAAIRQRRADEPKYVCRLCDRSCVRASNLREHEQRHENLRTYPCHEDGCDLSFNTKGDVRSHHKKVHARSQKSAAESP
ncbi:hypothetical protein BD626DRAFT_519560 [Schizophyllum amplum]|uniref:C2H2-type domain-containing protein n=1 Tax=Schizophyllum amplum TaxID=97359 RepID=A0A550BV82_9AGAR|nr:hypothetical protein BD626DRAFT_519560 [Auriculariopsis ampla]